MKTSKPPLLGRIAAQLKMISSEQLDALTAEQAKDLGKRTSELIVEMGLVSPAQLQKLEKVQKDVIAKARAKQGGGGAGNAKPSPASEVKPGPATQPSSEPVTMAPEAIPKAPITPPKPKPEAPAEPIDPELAKVVATAEPAMGAVEIEAKPEPAPAPVKAPNRKAKRAERAATASEEPEESLELLLSERQNVDRSGLEEILRDAVKGGASDIHVHTGNPVKYRIGGEMASTGLMPLDAAQSERLALAALSEDERDRLAITGEIDTCFELPGVGRFRTNVYRQQRGFDAVFRSISPKPPTLEELNLPQTLRKFTEYHQGMVLLTGPAGSGKSATMAALVNLINEERDEHILTVEDPIEYVHTPKRCLVNQRHAGRHTGSFARALRAALREDPDVIVIGELRDLETISLAMTAAETGHFVLATLHTANAVRTINRMIGAFPSNRQDQVRTMLSESLRAVVSQRLVNTSDEQSRIPALEVLVVNKAIGNLIRDEKTVQIRSSMQTGSSQGMYLLEQNLAELVRQKKISMEEAKRYAEDPKILGA